MTHPLQVIKMPTSNVFTGFTIDGENGTTINHDGTYNYGHNFWTNSNKNEIVFLPAVGCRRISDGLFSVGGFGYYWSAIPKSGGVVVICILMEVLYSH